MSTAVNPIQDAIDSTVNVYDAQGNEQTLTLSFLQSTTVPNEWTLNVYQGTLASTPTSAAPSAATPIGTATVDFDASGDILDVVQASGTQTAATNPTATVSLAASFLTTAAGMPVNQNINLNLGNFGTTSGLTQYAGSSYSLRSLTQDGCAPGSFSSVSMTTAGDVVVNYNNGESRTIAQVPVVTFSDPNGLQQEGSSTMAATINSGNAIADAAGINGAGTLETSSLEESNVDLSTEFTSLIVAQQAYAANAKVVTTADDMLNTDLNMKPQ